MSSYLNGCDVLSTPAVRPLVEHDTRTVIGGGDMCLLPSRARVVGDDAIDASASLRSRYAAAIKYASTEVALAIGRGTSNVVDLYAAQLKTAPFRSDLDKITARWDASSDDATRATIARDAELLADRVQEILPGASQARQRINLTNRAGIVPTGAPGDGYTEAPQFAPATSYAGEIEREAGARKKQLEDAFAIPTWAWIVGGAAVILFVGGVVLLPIVLPLLHARASAPRVILDGGAPRQLPRTTLPRAKK